jgi:catechol-2,3-dioxygenase
LEGVDAVATIAVKDLNRARKFYEQVLGLSPIQTDKQFVRYRSGGSSVLVYVSSFAGTNKATAATWNVGGDLEKIVAELKTKGATFEHYDMPQTVRKGDIHVAGTIRNAWLKDPDGNILSLVSG